MAIKLEAGKYYKTRDGRKVGPMGPEEGAFYLGLRAMPTLTDFPDRRLWWNNGRANASRESAEDLIEEWAEPKFKVGDRVRIIRNSVSSLSGRDRFVGNVVQIIRSEGEWDGQASWSMGPGNSYRWKDSELELVSSGPVRERTIKEVVSGQFGIVHVDADRPSGNPRITISAVPTHKELTDAITHLTAIRDALVSKE